MVHGSSSPAEGSISEGARHRENAVRCIDQLLKRPMLFQNLSSAFKLDFQNIIRRVGWPVTGDAEPVSEIGRPLRNHGEEARHRRHQTMLPPSVASTSLTPLLTTNAPISSGRGRTPDRGDQPRSPHGEAPVLASGSRRNFVKEDAIAKGYAASESRTDEVDLVAGSGQLDRTSPSAFRTGPLREARSTVRQEATRSGSEASGSTASVVSKPNADGIDGKRAESCLLKGTNCLPTGSDAGRDSGLQNRPWNIPSIDPLKSIGGRNGRAQGAACP